ncbi:sugar ABC transporter permease [Ruminococcus sp.]|jgi:arabinogalactan oligomer/maltooligosaccharide transport system permease protein|uniref:sugar ABC transporter permease n=1 Tax=Ruminococcus TaxID=1263 RepID=UPI0015C127AC|nr:sugar ABC transporter permease [uncultured Ruminococcus sp.]
MIKSYKLRRGLANTFIYIILAILGFIWICPFIYLLMHSFRAEGVTVVNYLIPREWTFQNYIDLFTSHGTLNFTKWFINTFVVACFSCVISTISVLMVSYAFSRLRFKSRKKFINVGMILGMFPGFMTMIAIYYLLKAMGLTQTLVALVICYSAGAGLGYQISKGFFDTIPRALDEAATIDGATKNQIFWKIILPMSKPIVVYTVLTSFIGPWTDFILAKIIMGDKRDNYTVAIGLQLMVDLDFKTQYYKQFLAGSVVVAVPITLLFLKMQKYYVEGVTAGGVKG